MVYLIIRDQNVYIKRPFFSTGFICFLFHDLIDQCLTSLIQILDSLLIGSTL